MKTESQPDELLLRLRLPDFDMVKIKVIQEKSSQTGFISVAELMELQKAGFRRPRDVPQEPTPKSPRILRGRERQRMFQGEPRSVL